MTHLAISWASFSLNWSLLSRNNFKSLSEYFLPTTSLSSSSIEIPARYSLIHSSIMYYSTSLKLTAWYSMSSSTTSWTFYSSSMFSLIESFSSSQYLMNLHCLNQSFTHIYLQILVMQINFTTIFRLHCSNSNAWSNLHFSLALPHTTLPAFTVLNLPDSIMFSTLHSCSKVHLFLSSANRFSDFRV